MCVRVINCLRHARLVSHQDVVTSAASGDGNSDNVEGQGQLYLYQFHIWGAREGGASVNI